jgi:putative GTP pyrophosphokinase
MSNIEHIKEEFLKNKSIYISLEKITNGLISTLISNEGLLIHSLTSRSKTEKSLMGKINRPDKNYSSINDLTDIFGLRITTYFSDHVDLISNLIEREFKVDTINSIDKRKAIEPDRFGYMSLHLVVEHSDLRTNLPEYQKFKGIKFEIQIRTILQHAWAEIEHDIGYKSSEQVPINLRRKFSRLSGLLELADDEFLSIRKEIHQYKTDLPETIKSTPEAVSLDIESLESFVRESELISKIEIQFCSVFKSRLVNSDIDMLRGFLSHLNVLGINSIQQLIDVYTERFEIIIPFLKKWLSYDERKTYSKIYKGISLLYICYIIVAERNDDELFAKFINNAPFMNKSTLKSRILDVYADVQKK